MAHNCSCKFKVRIWPYTKINLNKITEINEGCFQSISSIIVSMKSIIIPKSHEQAI